MLDALFGGSIAKPGSSDQLSANSKVFADLGNVFSSPFAVGRGSNASAEATKSASAESPFAAPQTDYVKLIVIGGGVLAALIILPSIVKRL